MTTYRKPPEQPAYGPTTPPAGLPRLERRSRVRQSAATLPEPSTMVPWSALADSASLAIVLGLVVARLGLAEPEARLFLAALTASSLYIWVLFLQFRSLATILRQQRAFVYAMPFLAASGTAAVLAFGGVALPWSDIGLYVAVWTAGLLVGRQVVSHNQAPLRVLLIGSPPFRRELEGRRDFEVVSLDEPPARVNGFDIVATDPAEAYDRDWLQWISHADMYDVKVISAPLPLETVTNRVPTEMLHGRWVFEVLNGRSRYLFWERLFDVVAVVLAAPFLLLLAAVVALVVWFDSGRPILFVQQRVGLGGRPFKMVKFRTMVTNAEQNGSAFAEDADPRITRVGRLLRQFRLDEIPQFWNVLRGDMSIIGPRPEQLAFAD